jgi:ABC transporter DrrB family efflux protein
MSPFTRRWHPFGQLVLARVREFFREPEALFWVYGFPLVLAIGLGLAFSGGEPPHPAIDVQATPDPAKAKAVADLLTDKGFSVEVCPPDECEKRLVLGHAALFLVVTPDGYEYHYDRARAESVLARYWVESELLRHRSGIRTEPTEVLVTAPGSRYIDFLLPGLVGMNLMGGGLFGVGFVLVDMRVRKLFKRLMATPMRHSDFLLALLTSRLLFLLPEMLTLLVIGRWLFGVPIYGSVFTVALIVFVGAAAFAGLGLLLGSRTEKTETMSGFINLVMLPMYILSGVFFSSRRFPDEIQPFIQALPLTQLIDALREVMLEGKSIALVGWRIAILAAWAVVTFAVALRWFKWR